MSPSKPGSKKKTEFVAPPTKGKDFSFLLKEKYKKKKNKGKKKLMTFNIKKSELTVGDQN